MNEIENLVKSEDNRQQSQQQRCRKRVNNLGFMVAVAVCLLVTTVSGAETPKNNSFRSNVESEVSKRVFNLTSGRFVASPARVINRIVDRLIGVPYGESPRLFEKPVPYRNRDDADSKPREANKWSPMCIQPVIFHNSFYGNFKLPHGYDMSFNCLSMNIYVPRGLPQDLPENEGGEPEASADHSDTTRRKPAELKSVMFFIHGGSNAAGAASFMDGSALAAAGQVIVVMPNYRLDVLGFLNLHNSSHSRGNYGLWDLLLALKWLYVNCPSLGCDPKSITVFGHSAGSSDTMLLALSPLAQPYIRRVIMQSGSGLAHWSFLYETHLMHKKHKPPKSFDSVDTRFSKYVMSLHDTFENFLIHTTCTLTSKYDCIRSRLVSFIRLTSNMVMANKPTSSSSSSSRHQSESNAEIEQQVINYIDKAIDLLDLDEFMSLFGYLFKQLKQHYGLAVFNVLSANTTIDKMLFVYKPSESNNGSSASVAASRMNARISALLNRLNAEKKGNDSDSKSTTSETTTTSTTTPTSNVSKSSASSSSCPSEVAFFIRNHKGLKYTCEFLRPFANAKMWSNLLASQVMRYFMGCFKLYNRVPAANEHETNGRDFSLPFNGELVVSEMKKCYDPNFKSSNSVREVSYLTENSNYLHRPTVDGELIREMPHDELKTSSFINSQIDVLVGLTSHESFYFLLHDYSINDILLHTLIYSSILNYTDNIVEKLDDVQNSPQLSICLKKNLFNYYKMSMTDQELVANSLKNKIQSIELISDFDFVLPMITHLMFYANYSGSSPEETSGGLNKSRLYVYEYSHITSFNYLLDHLKSFHMGYDQALVALNNSVVPHFSELDFVFGLPLLSMSNLIKNKSRNKHTYNYTKDEIEFSLMVIDYWTNFAKHGDPNFNSSKEAFVRINRPRWEHFEASNPSVFKLAAKKQEHAKKSQFDEWLAKHEFWYRTLPNKIFDECKQRGGHYKAGSSSSSSSSNISILVFMAAHLLIMFLVSR